MNISSFNSVPLYNSSADLIPSSWVKLYCKKCSYYIPTEITSRLYSLIPAEHGCPAVFGIDAGNLFYYICPCEQEGIVRAIHTGVGLDSIIELESRIHLEPGQENECPYSGFRVRLSDWKDMYDIVTRLLKEEMAKV